MGSNPTADIFMASGRKQRHAGAVTGEGDVGCHDSLAERSKAVAQGAIPKGRGFEPHRRHFTLTSLQALENKATQPCTYFLQ